MAVSRVQRKVFIAAYWALLFCVVCRAACPGDGSNVIAYTPISEPYDRNYSSITSADDTHPLGFYRGVWYYNQADMPNPCISITADHASTRKLEIMVETVPSARLCYSIRDQTTDPVCFQGRKTTCSETPGDTIYVEFMCDSQCQEGDVLFWYRLRLSKLPQEEDLDLFCLNVGSEYPEDLLTLPPGATLPTYTTPGGPTGQGSTMRPWALLTVFLVACQQRVQ